MDKCKGIFYNGLSKSFFMLVIYFSRLTIYDSFSRFPIYIYFSGMVVCFEPKTFNWCLSIMTLKCDLLTIALIAGVSAFTPNSYLFAFVFIWDLSAYVVERDMFANFLNYDLSTPSEPYYDLFTIPLVKDVSTTTLYIGLSTGGNISEFEKRFIGVKSFIF